MLRQIRNSGLVLLQSGTASAVASQVITFDNTFKEIKIEIIGAAPSTSGRTLTMQWSDDNGATFYSAASSYSYDFVRGFDSSSTLDGSLRSTGATSIALIGAASFTNKLDCSMTFYAPSDTSRRTWCGIQYFNLSAGGSHTVAYGGAAALYASQLNQVNAIKLIIDSGTMNFDYLVYGVS